MIKETVCRYKYCIYTRIGNITMANAKAIITDSQIKRSMLYFKSTVVAQFAVIIILSYVYISVFAVCRVKFAANRKNVLRVHSQYKLIYLLIAIYSEADYTVGFYFF